MGKLAIAVAFASQLLGENNAMVRRLEHPDLHFTYPTIKLPSMSADHKPVSDDFAREWHELIMQGPYFSMDQWLAAIGAENQQAIITAGESDELVRKLSLKSSQGGYKVCIVWLPERMNGECANKLLKLIEEPPLHTVFLMACEEPDKLLETIRSRVQRIDVKRIPEDTLCQALISRRGIDDQQARREPELPTARGSEPCRSCRLALRTSSSSTSSSSSCARLICAMSRNCADGATPWPPSDVRSRSVSSTISCT